MFDLGQQQWLQDPRLAQLFTIIENAGGEARVAGGAVRNGLWGLSVKDIDVATTLLPQETVSVVKNAGLAVYPTGIDHGTVTVLIDGLTIEVTTLRADVETDGRRAVVGFTKNWPTDAERRDFTFNALYCDLSGKVYDETGSGLQDLATRRVRFVGNNEQRIREDYLRILRYFRFEAQYGKGAFDDEALAACVALQSGLKQLSAERIQAELFKTLAAPRAVPVIELMIETGILQQLLTLDGTVETLSRIIALQDQIGTTPDALGRLAALTSDVTHLRLSKAQNRRFEVLKKPVSITPRSEELIKRQLLYGLGQTNYRDAIMMAWLHSSATTDDADWQQLYDLPDHWPIPVFPLMGKDLLASGFPSGKQIGDILKKLENQWIANGFVDNKSVLIDKAGLLKN